MVYPPEQHAKPFLWAAMRNYFRYDFLQQWVLYLEVFFERCNGVLRLAQFLQASC